MAEENHELVKSPGGPQKTELSSPDNNRTSRLVNILRLFKLKKPLKESRVPTSMPQMHPGNLEKDPSIQIETAKTVKSFKTAMGSVYTYDQEGKTTRFKTAAQEQQERQDLTVFVDLDFEEEQQVLRAYRHIDMNDKDSKVYVIEKQQNDSVKIVRDKSEIVDPENIYLGILSENKWSLIKKASINPIIGRHVFDTRYYQENGQRIAERHLGNKVTEIEYYK